MICIGGELLAAPARANYVVNHDVASVTSPVEQALSDLLVNRSVDCLTDITSSEIVKRLGAG